MSVSCSKTILSPQQLIVKSAEAARNGKWTEAKAYALKAYRQSPDNFEVLLMLSITQDNCNYKKEALNSISQACKLNNKSFLAFFLKGKLLVELEKYGDSIAPLKHALELKPTDIYTVILLAKASAKLNLPEAVKYYAFLAKKFKTRSEPYNELGLLLAESNVRKALKCLLIARKLDKDNPAITLNLAVFCDNYLNNRKYAKKFYNLYLAQTRANSVLKEKRDKVLKRLKVLGIIPFIINL